MEWYYAKEGKRFGPVDRAELARLVVAGELRPTDLVWNPTMGQQWILASTVPNLFPAPPPLVPTPAPPPRAVSAGRWSTPNRDLTRMARESLRNRWGIAIGFMVLMMVVSFAPGVIPFVGGVASLIIAGPLSVGCAVFFLALVRGAEPQIAQLFAGFNRFGTALCAYLLMTLFVFLWFLLLIIPGIVAALSYALTFYVITDNPAMGALEAIRKGKEMMRGYRWKLFCLGWRFFGWALLCIITCGVGFLWLFPYMNTSMAHFYEDVRPRTA